MGSGWATGCDEVMLDMCVMKVVGRWLAMVAHPWLLEVFVQQLWT